MNALHATVSLVAFFIYGFSCYQIGKSMQIANTASSAFSLAASQALGFPMEQSNNGGDGSTSVGGGEDLRNSNETIAQLYRMSKVTRTKMTEKKSERGLPFKCGMVFYYHVPCTGGSVSKKTSMIFVWLLCLIRILQL